MRVEMLRLMASPKYGNQPEGAIVDMDDAEAARRIAAGDCRPVDEPRRRKAARAKAATGGTETGGDGQDGPPPVEEMTVDQLKAFAAGQEIDLGDAKKKAELLAVVVAELERRRDEDEGAGD
ncbi:hypothetical protein ACFUJR_27750 [Streptomyces sp. NPDC057271]|uniref:hypothetical protein n=1 Tax=unclassified Streptomyces TaxID=2593676 RepID=UPI003637161D